MKKGYKRVWLVIDVIMFLALVALDQYTKHLAVINLKGKPDIILVEGWLQLSYLENRGAAFGMLQNQKVFFIFVVIVVLALILYMLYKLPDMSKYIPMYIMSSILASGAVGNMIDRVKQDYVVDFIYFSKINFPVFNTADICVTISAFLLVFLLLFKYQEDDLNFLGMKQKRLRNM